MKINYVSLAIGKQPFTSKAEMDEAIKLHLAEHGGDLSDTAIAILRLLSQYSCKYPGVSYLKNDTIAKAIGKSRITVIRNIKQLINSGVIEKVTIMRAINGGNGANMYVINPLVATCANATGEYNDDTPQVIHRESSVKLRESKEKRPIKITEPYSLLNKDNNYVLDTRSLRQSIPPKLFDTMSPFFNVKELHAMIGVLYRAKASVDRTIRAEKHMEYTDVFLAAIRRYKAGKVKSLSTYLYVAWRKCSRTIFMREMADIYG